MSSGTEIINHGEILYGKPNNYDNLVGSSESEFDNNEESEKDAGESAAGERAAGAITRLSDVCRVKMRDTSIVWRYFNCEKDNQQAVCKLCCQVCKTKGNTSNLFDHLKRKHVDVLRRRSSDEDDLDPDNNCTEKSKENLLTSNKVVTPGSITTYFNCQDAYASNSAKKKFLDQKLAMMIAKDFQPLSIVEDVGFIEFTKALNPRYKMLSRKALTCSIFPQLFKTALINVRKNISECKGGVALTVDGWTSCSNQSYLGVTCHFISTTSKSLESVILDTIPILKDEKSETLKQILSDLMNEWQITEKTKCIVTDNAANMVKAVDLLKIRHLPCFAHTLNLVLKNAVTRLTKEVSSKNSSLVRQDAANISSTSEADTVSNIITLCKNLVTFFHTSPKATRLLNNIKNENVEEGERMPTKSIQQTDIRWHTTLYLLQSISENIEYIKLLKLNDDYSESDLVLPMCQQLVIIKEVIKILKPFEEITVTVSGEKYATVSSIIPSVHALWRQLSSIADDTSLSNASRNFLSHVMQLVKEKLFTYETRSVCRLSTLLDPRFKKAAFIHDNNYSEAVSLLKTSAFPEN